MTRAQIEFTVLENARDFLDETIFAANSDQKSAWKYAIISLASAIELVLKSILKEEHWCLLFENINLASKAQLEEGRFKSVDFETALTRAEQIAGVKLNVRDKKYLASLRHLRNQAVHLHLNLNVDMVKAIVARGIVVFLGLYEAPLLEKYRDKNYEAKVNHSLKDFDKYVSLKMTSLRRQIESSKRPDGHFTCCHACDQNAIVLVEGEFDAKCLYCGDASTLAQLAGRRSELPVRECPECSQDTLAFFLYNNEAGEFVCANCGFKTASLEHCWECGADFIATDDETICPNCWDYKLSRD